MSGLSLRDYFAAMAMPILLADYCKTAKKAGFHEEWQMLVALDAYSIADAMLAERKLSGNSEQLDDGPGEEDGPWAPGWEERCGGGA